jgi:hypothetical protein
MASSPRSFGKGITPFGAIGGRTLKTLGHDMRPLPPKKRNIRNIRNMPQVERSLMFHINPMFRNRARTWNTKPRINSRMFHVFRLFRLIRRAGSTRAV